MQPPETERAGPPHGSGPQGNYLGEAEHKVSPHPTQPLPHPDMAPAEIIAAMWAWSRLNWRRP